jgi:hypothetical protein
MFALLNMSVMDAYICVFDNKFHFNHWRPFTAIRWAANDGNPNTAPDPKWNNLHRQSVYHNVGIILAILNHNLYETTVVLVFGIYFAIGNFHGLPFDISKNP